MCLLLPSGGEERIFFSEMRENLFGDIDNAYLSSPCSAEASMMPDLTGDGSFNPMVTVTALMCNLLPSTGENQRHLCIYAPIWILSM